MKIAKDKWQHFTVCMIVAAVIAAIVGCTCTFPLPACLAGFLGAVACGAGKEYGDSKAQGNTWSWADMAADMAGAVVGCLAGLTALIN